jgi:anion-transporting  ArsA/GET3 family ATPase
VDLDEFLHPKILIVSGKGGVGKTTVSAALALVAARHGRKVCVAEVDQKGSLPKHFGEPPVGYEPKELSPGVYGMNIVPDRALAEYLDVQYHMKRISRIFTSSHFVDYITMTAPGLEDILVLGKIWYLEQGRTGPSFDTIIVDAPAAGHMLQFLSTPMGLSDAVRVGPVQRQADWLTKMLQDPDRCRVHLVSLPEEMPIAETIETSTALREKIEVSTGAIFANAVYPELLTPDDEQRLDAIMGDGVADELYASGREVGLNLEREDLDSLVGYARFLAARRGIQNKHLRALRRGVEEPVIELPVLFSSGLALPDIEQLADSIEEGVVKL